MDAARSINGRHLTMKKTFNIAALLALTPSVAFAACNADNVLRALEANAPKASPFCSTYTLPPPDQPLPTYVSQYPASRVSSGCSCLITTGPTTLTTSTTSTTSTTATTATTSTTLSSSISTTSTTTSTTPTFVPGQIQCSGELVRNGAFQTIANGGGAPPWEFALPVNPNSGEESRASLVVGADGNNYATMTIKNSPTGGYGSTYVTQPIPDLCKYVFYTLSFNAKTEVYEQYTGKVCRLEIGIAGSRLVYNAPGSTEYLPYEYQKRSYTFQYGGCAPYGVRCSPQSLTVRFTCEAPMGTFLIDNISLIGAGDW
ncbi:MAG: hypothetical protein Q9211_001798 [Gyalolechia sp. 1 TL-2023]